jgi:hypothetical protein
MQFLRFVLLVSSVGLALAVARQALAQTSLADEVKKFNQSAAKDPIGKNEPALTEDEVVAAIRGCVKQKYPDMPAETYAAMKRIADTGQLQKGSAIEHLNSWGVINGYNFDVWWVDLNIPSSDGKGGYTYRIRDRKIKAYPVKAANNHAATDEPANIKADLASLANELRSAQKEFRDRIAKLPEYHLAQVKFRDCEAAVAFAKLEDNQGRLAKAKKAQMAAENELALLWMNLESNDPKIKEIKKRITDLTANEEARSAPASPVK